MKTVSPDLFGISPLAWLMLPLFLLLLSRTMDRNGKVRGSGMGMVAASLVIFGAVALTRSHHFI